MNGSGEGRAVTGGSGEGRTVIGGSGEERAVIVAVVKGGQLLVAVVKGVQESNAQDKAMPPPSGSRQLRANRAQVIVMTMWRSLPPPPSAVAPTAPPVHSAPRNASCPQPFLLAPHVQGEVHEDEDREETESQRSLHWAKVSQTGTSVHFQHLLPVSATQRHTAGHNAQGIERQLFTFMAEENGLALLFMQKRFNMKVKKRTEEIENIIRVKK
ncbi:hypothetical protein E2C01_071145 [Portunus trituberculatus]|uniref:Uncharacterized protein n=1 Tax=Portunus trituberculatus TaxID=210409 RepID=A0A5B7I4E8_PORTR|nr:hypothetical protein [Portunus trituberculatus]